MRPEPYIGISGIMSRDELWALREELSGLKRPIAYGVLVSSKTVRGIPNKYPNRYPRMDALNGIFKMAQSHYLITLHYSADDDRTLCEDVGLAINAIGRAPDGLQINIRNPYGELLPHPNKVAAIASVYPKMRIILQLVPTAFSSRAELWRHVRDYAFAITDVLIDGSRGNGVDYFAHPSNVLATRADLLELRSSFPHLGLGIAGGLCAATLPQVADLLGEIPDLSIDAEGRLRDSDDHLDVNEAVRYVLSASRMVTP